MATFMPTDPLVEQFDRVPFQTGKPNLLLTRTVKGKGISFMEDVKNWHHKVPSEEQLHAAMQELEAAHAALEKLS